MKTRNLDLDLGTHLFVKVPQPGDSEVTFAVFKLKFCNEKSSHIVLTMIEKCVLECTTRLTVLSFHHCFNMFF